MRVLGLMSGTKTDGVDAVLVRFSGRLDRPRWTILAEASVPYPAELRQRLVEVGQGLPISSAAWLDLSEAVSELQAAAAQACDPKGHAQLIGCHGQTLWHRPPDGLRRGASLQLLQGPLLATVLRRPVIVDFRAADLAAGGQGAPLVPPADAALLGRSSGWRGVLNLGGIANLTLIPPAQGPERQAPLQGWDCGPANSLLDLAVQHLSGGEQLYDEGGRWAARGQVAEALVQRWLQEPYLQQRPPKSTGRDVFGAADLKRRLGEMDQWHPADALATLTAFSAACVALGLNQHAQTAGRAIEVLVAGGGCRNATLMRELQWRCRGTSVRPLAHLGIGDAQREALAFALLAWWHQHRHPGNAPSVTGAQRPVVLGVRVDPA